MEVKENYSIQDIEILGMSICAEICDRLKDIPTEEAEERFRLSELLTKIFKMTRYE